VRSWAAVIGFGLEKLRKVIYTMNFRILKEKVMEGD